MPDSTELKLSPRFPKLGFPKPGFPKPRTMGSFIMLVTALAFGAGWLRDELALTLLGTVFLVILVYCYLGVFFLGIIYRNRARVLSMTIVPDTVNVGGEAEVFIKNEGVDISGTGAKGTGAKRGAAALPAILVRSELCLKTRDGRVIRHYVDPASESSSGFPVSERGAYYSGSGAYDRLVIFDAPGFFRLAFPLAPNTGPRLFAVPHPAEEPVPLWLRSGGSEQRSEPHYRKSDELTDHRPYVPGDDPRRINWKLYGHAPLGELFVREGEPEPPPHSRLLILIDTEADSSLYTLAEARLAVDILCENALVSALEFSSHGMDIHIGYSGGEIIGSKEESAPLNPAELALAMAMPAAILWPGKKADSSGAVPGAPNDGAVLIFALPRVNFDASVPRMSGLDNFLKTRGASQGADIVFIYDITGLGARRAVELEDAAVACVNFYNRRPGVHAEKVKHG